MNRNKDQQFLGKQRSSLPTVVSGGQTNTVTFITGASIDEQPEENINAGSDESYSSEAKFNELVKPTAASADPLTSQTPNLSVSNNREQQPNLVTTSNSNSSGNSSSIMTTTTTTASFKPVMAERNPPDKPRSCSLSGGSELSTPTISESSGLHYVAHRTPIQFIPFTSIFGQPKQANHGKFSASNQAAAQTQIQTQTQAQAAAQAQVQRRARGQSNPNAMISLQMLHPAMTVKPQDTFGSSQIADSYTRQALAARQGAQVQRQLDHNRRYSTTSLVIGRVNCHLPLSNRRQVYNNKPIKVRRSSVLLGPNGQPLNDDQQAFNNRPNTTTTTSDIATNNEQSRARLLDKQEAQSKRTLETVSSPFSSNNNQDQQSPTTRRYTLAR